MDKPIQDLLNDNNRYTYNRNKAYSILNKYRTIPELFDFLFTGSPVTTAYSSFFPESEMFDHSLLNLNQALANECNKRIKELGLDKTKGIEEINTTADYTSISLGITFDISTKDLCFRNSVYFDSRLTMPLYTDIAKHGVFEIGRSKPIEIIVYPKYSSLPKVWYFKWDKEKRLPIRNENYSTALLIGHGSFAMHHYMNKMLKRYFKLPIRKINLGMVVGSMYLDNEDKIRKDALSNARKDAELFKSRYNKYYIDPLITIYTKLFKKQVEVKPLEVELQSSNQFYRINS